MVHSCVSQIQISPVPEAFGLHSASSRTVAHRGGRLQNGATMKRTHGQSTGGRNGRGTSEFEIWLAMRQRCGNPNYSTWKYYGGRGITVCKRWINSFENFYRDMGPRPSSKHSIDRINGNRNYTPKNCRWATKMEQMSHTRRSRRISFRGQTKTVAEWERVIGCRRGFLYSRLHGGFSVARAMTQPQRVFRRTKILHNPLL